MKSFFFSIFLGREDFESRELCFDPTMEFGYVGGGGCCVMHWMSTIILGSFRNNWEAVRLFQINLIFL